MSKNAKWLKFKPQNLFNPKHALRGLNRFPIACLFVLTFAVLVLYYINQKTFGSEPSFGLLFGSGLAAYAAMVMVLMVEGKTLWGKGQDKTSQSPSVFKFLSFFKFSSWPVQIAVGLILITASYFYTHLSFFPPLLTLAIILFIGSAPFWVLGRDDDRVWDFTHKIWVAVIFTIAGSILYVLGLLSILVAMNSLFGLNIEDLITEFFIPLGLTFFAPLAWMSMIPKPDETDENGLRGENFISNAVGFLGTWLLVPMVLIYAAILLAYGAKILMTMSIPNGEVAALVSPFLVVGCLTWLILDPPFIRAKKLAQIFRRVWFYIMLPASILLLVALWMRVGEYGITIPRYLLCLLVVWSLGVSIWFIVKKIDGADIRFIPNFAALLLALSSIGPWGAQGFSNHNQFSRLKTVLESNDLLDKDGHLLALENIEYKTDEDAIRVKASLKYLLKSNGKGHIKRVLSAADDEIIDAENDGKIYPMKVNVFERFVVMDTVIPNKYNNYGTIAKTHHFDVDDKFVTITQYEKTSTPKHASLRSKDDTSWTEIHLPEQYRIKFKNGDVTIYNVDKQVGEFELLDHFWSLPINANKQMQMSPVLEIYSEDDREIALLITSMRLNKFKDKASNGSLSFQVLLNGFTGEVSKQTYEDVGADTMVEEVKSKP